jgi:hypothetical protein
MKSIMLTACVLCCALSKACAQELIGTQETGLRIPLEQQADYYAVRVDETGKIIWRRDFVESSIPFDYSQDLYMVYGFTEVDGEKIKGNPDDYEYWLVRREYTPVIAVWPNPTNDFFSVQTSSYRGSILEIYDATLRLVKRMEIQNETTTIDVAGLSPGTYIYKMIFSDNIAKGGKLCVL